MANSGFHIINSSSRLAPQTRCASHFRATIIHCMGNANLFHSLGERKIPQTQQHTGYEVLETVSSREIVFHPRAASETRYSLCQQADDKKRRIFRSTPAELKCYFKYLTDPAFCVLARTPQGLRQAAPLGTSSLQPWVPSPSRRTARPSLRLQQHRRSEEHTSELQSHLNLVCRLLLEKKKKKTQNTVSNKLRAHV